jgi:branched-chain amino acid transport system permease protein
LSFDIPFNLQILANGILAGGVLALVAVGFSLVWGIMNIINLAHGAFIMIGAYIAWVLFTALHVDPFLSIPITFACLFALGYVVQRFLINFVVRAPILTTFLLTFGLSLLLVNVVLLIFHGDIKGITTWYSGARFKLGPVVIPWTKFLTLLVALAITIVLQLWLTRSKTGRAIRATAMDINAAQLSGVKVAEIYALVFAIGAGLAGAAGSLISLWYGLQPSMGDAFIVKGFVVCVLGGLGSVEGALVGGIVYGIIESFGSQYIGSGLQDAVALVVLLLVLAVRPTGILGKATA